MTEVEWADPPKPVKREAVKKVESKWRPVAEKMRQNPGKWALLRKDIPRVAVYSFRQGRFAYFRPAEDWEFLVVVEAHHVKGKGDLYGRYVGENGEFRDRSVGWWS